MSIPSFRDRDSIWLFVFFLSLYSLTMSGHLYTADGVLAYETTRSLAQQGSLELPAPGFLTPANTEGKPVSPYAWGQPVLLVPFYWLGLLGGRLLANSAEMRETWCLVCVVYSSVVIGALLVVATRFLALALGAERRAALFTALVAGCGSFLWVYSQDLFRNPLAALLLTTAVASLLRVRDQPKLVHLSGLALLLLMQVRIDGILALPILFIWLIWTSRPRFSAVVVRWVLWCTGGLVLLGLNNWVRFGNPFQHNMPEAFFTESLLISIPGFLWSADKSIFLYSPPILLILFAIPALWRRGKRETMLILAVSLVYLVWYGKFHHWFGGRCWGPRYTILFTPLLLATIGPWLSAPIRFRWIAAWTLLLIGVLIQLIGLLIEQNVHIGFHHFDTIVVDLWAGCFDPWWAYTWDSYPVLTFTEILALVALCSLSAVKLTRRSQA
ncbi:MAG: hypothetical protein ABIH23_02960 [bacterium]